MYNLKWLGNRVKHCRKKEIKDVSFVFYINRSIKILFNQILSTQLQMHGVNTVKIATRKVVTFYSLKHIKCSEIIIWLDYTSHVAEAHAQYDQQEQ